MLHKFYTLIWLCMVMAIFPCVPCKGQESDAAIEVLRKAAKAENKTEITERENGESFTSGALGLQRLNPEISVSGDILWSYMDAENNSVNSDFMFRGLGVHMEAYLDPFTKFKAALEFHEHETELGEAYMTRFGLLPNVSLTLGKFRQQFGVVNRWHKHGLDQVDFPLALRQIFGEDGLNQAGASIDWSIPGIAGFSHELTLQVTDGENDRVFGENSDNTASSLAHYKIYRDLTDSTYAELGVSGLYGKNNEWHVLDSVEDRSLGVMVAGIDFTLLWEPTHRMRYRNLTWRSEAYSISKDVLTIDGSGEDTINAWGAYSYLESKVSRTFTLGVRGDYFVPDTKTYAEYTDTVGETTSLAPLVVTEDSSCRWQVGPYITWYQSPFVHFRTEYNHQDGDGTGPAEDIVWLQCIFAAGPHKHERY